MPNLCVVAKPLNGLIGDDGVEFSDSTEGAGVTDAGASMINVRSSDVRFDA